ncbi:MAG: M64 family metallopeptidase [Chitinophagaceae bacterium]
MRLIFIITFFFLCCRMNAQLNVEIQPDGKSYSKVLLSGSTSEKYDIVFIGDGFAKSDQALFNQRVVQAMQGIQSKDPFSNNMCSFNIWKVNLISTDSGISDPNIGRQRQTELGCRFGDRRKGELVRCIYTAFQPKCYEAAGLAPAYDAIIVLVNDPEWGGCESDLVFSTIAPDFPQIITHELGHKVGQLADEYDCWVCERNEKPRTYNGPEPQAINVTTYQERAQIKWAQFIQQETSIPTRNDRPIGVVGLFEGGLYYSKGIFRPQKNCHMKTSETAFCTVCRGEMVRRLSQYCRAR